MLGEQLCRAVLAGVEEASKGFSGGEEERLCIAKGTGQQVVGLVMMEVVVGRVACAVVWWSKLKQKSNGNAQTVMGHGQYESVSLDYTTILLLLSI